MDYNIYGLNLLCISGGTFLLMKEIYCSSFLVVMQDLMPGRWDARAPVTLKSKDFID